MKKLTLLTMLVMLSACSQAVEQPTASIPPPAPVEEPKTKLVCIDKMTKDGKIVYGKDGKPLQDCRTMKVHKKLDGTPVPKK